MTKNLSDLYAEMDTDELVQALRVAFGGKHRALAAEIIERLILGEKLVIEVENLMWENSRATKAH